MIIESRADFQPGLSFKPGSWLAIRQPLTNRLQTFDKSLNPFSPDDKTSLI